MIMDYRSVYATSVLEPSIDQNEDTPLQIQQQLETFIREFRIDNKYVYRCVLFPGPTTRVTPETDFL